MCGICGIHGPSASPEPIATMVAQMAHRGPDGTGLWHEPGIALGHRRLAIVDLSERGRQPMLAEDGRIAISVNGEIYNYHELRLELEAHGCHFQSDCDSETVIHAWRQWGEDSFRRFNGMFAIALWDAKSRVLYLVRDQMGIKPIYYWRNGETTLFASDMRAIVAASGRSEWPISSEGLLQYLTYENRFGGETMLAGMRMVEPGCYVRIDDDGITSATFADPLASTPIQTNFEDAVARFPERFNAAVGRHLMSDVPLASYLSAGIDSGLVTVTAATMLDRKGPATFTGSFDAGGWFDEGTGAAMVASSMQLKHSSVHIGSADFSTHFDDLVYALEEPRMGTGALPQYLVARRVAETHKVVLTGHGGDELFSGYPVFKLVQLATLLRTDLMSFLRALRSLRISELPHLAYFILFGRGEMPFLPVLFGQQLRKRMLRSAVAKAIEQPVRLSDRPKPRDRTETLMEQYLKRYLPGLLVVEDKVSMAHALESRTPFLDNELVAWALSLPMSAKLHAGELKAIPRAAARGKLPDALFSMPKRGFPNPLGQWLRGPLAEWMETRLCGPNSALDLLFEPQATRRFVKEYQASWRRRFRPLDEISTHRVWMLLCLESWIRQFNERLGVKLLAPDDRGSW